MCYKMAFSKPLAVFAATGVFALGLSAPLVAQAKPDQQAAQSAQAKPVKAKPSIQAVPSQTLAAIRQHTAKVIGFYKPTNPQFGKNEASIKALEQLIVLYVSQPRNEADKAQFIQRYGSFLGETMIALYGGQWVYINGALALRGKNGIMAYPYASIRNRLDGTRANAIYMDMMVYKQFNAATPEQLKQILGK